MALWTPNNAIVKPLIWLDASDVSTITLNGSGVLNWEDKGTDSLDAYQTNASFQPQLIQNALNGKPVVSFNGSSQFLQFAQTRSMIDKTFLILFDYTEGGNGSFLGDAPQRFLLTSRMNFFATGYPNSNPTSGIAMGTGWNIAQADHHATLNYFTNGVLDPVTQTRSYTAASNFSNFARSISQNWAGRIAVFLMLPSPLSEDERQKYEGWLAHNWGVANSLLLPSHPYYNNPPVTEIIVPVTVPNAPIGARYRISNKTRNNSEIENGLVTWSNGISTTFIADDDSVPHIEGDTIHIDITYPVSTTAFLPSKIIGEVSANGVSGFIAQNDDEIYNFHAINGSTLNKFNANFIQNTIEINENLVGAEVYAFYVHSLLSESGIREWLGAITAIDIANFRINIDVMPLIFDNQTEYEYWQTDNVRIFRSDNARPVKNPTTGGGGLDINWRSQVYSVIISTADSVITGDISDIPSAVQAGMTAQGYTLQKSNNLNIIPALL